MAQIFPHKYRDPDQGFVLNEPAVYKLHFGKKYFIWKGKTLKGSVEQNFTDIYKLYLRSLVPADHLFFPIVSYIRKARVLAAEVEVIIQTTDPKQLLQAEADALNTGRDDENCLNAVFEPHIPKWLAEALEQFKPAVKPGPAKKKKAPASNKAITDTFTPIDDITPVKSSVKSPVVAKTGPGKLSKLAEAFAKMGK